MLKQTLALVGLTLSMSANAAIQSIDSSFGTDTITRDTATGLDWLDVTVTRGLSYNQVTAQMGSEGAYEGWRYATAAEFDQLITGFGYIAVNQNCASGVVHCDTNISGDSLIIEDMINTLGDTDKAYLDTISPSYYPAPDGAGYTYGILGSQQSTGGRMDVAMIYDSESVVVSTGEDHNDWDDQVVTLYSEWKTSKSSLTVGSFLVNQSTAPTPAVPIPAAAWLFGSALVGLVGFKRKK